MANFGVPMYNKEERVGSILVNQHPQVGKQGRAEAVQLEPFREIEDDGEVS